MAITKLKKGEELRVKTERGLDVRLHTENVEIELDRALYGVDISLVDDRSVHGVTAPPGAYYRISFYRPESNSQVNGGEVKNVMGGAIYLSGEGVQITGCTPHPSKYKCAVIDYTDRR